MGAVAQQFMTLGAAVVQEVAKLKLNPRNSVRSASTSLAKQLTLLWCRVPSIKALALRQIPVPDTNALLPYHCCRVPFQTTMPTYHSICWQVVSL